MDKILKNILDDFARKQSELQATFLRDQYLIPANIRAGRCAANIHPCERRRKSCDNTCMHYPDPENITLED
jgi:hypothetical protein